MQLARLPGLASSAPASPRDVRRDAAAGVLAQPQPAGRVQHHSWTHHDEITEFCNANLFNNNPGCTCYRDDEAHFRFWMQWNYANLVHPATKSGRCPFIISKQGVGKDTLVMILQKMLLGLIRLIRE